MDERSNGAIPSEAALSLETFDEQRGIRRDPEERPVDSTDQKQVREKMLDKTLADFVSHERSALDHTGPQRGLARLSRL